LCVGVRVYVVGHLDVLAGLGAFDGRWRLVLVRRGGALRVCVPGGG